MNSLLCLENIVSNSPLLDMDVSSNPFNCDCKDHDIIALNRVFAKSHWLDRVNCEEPPDLYNWKV